MNDDAKPQQAPAPVEQSAPRCYSIPAPPRARPADTFTAEGNLVWFDLGDGN